MTLPAQRYQEVDTELQRIKHYLAGLAREIEQEAPDAEKRGATWVATLEAEHAIGHIRYLLDIEQRQARMGEELRRRLTQKRKLAQVERERQPEATTQQ